MGVSQPINQNHNVEGMQLTCSKCIKIPKILNLDYNNYSIEYECPEHGIKTEDIKEYIKSSKKYLSESNRNNNSENINDENQNQIFFYCTECKNFLCEICRESHEHEKSLLKKINEPINKDDINLNNYCNCCVCYIHLFDDQKINNRNIEDQDIDSQFLEKIKNIKKEIEEKIENEKCINELLNRLIAIYEGQNNYLNKNNLIKVYENII